MIMITMITMMMIIKILLIGWFLTQLKDMYIKVTQLKIRKLIDILNLMGCLKCNSFWVGIILTQNIWVALTVSFIAYLIDKYILTTPIEL